MLALFLAMLAGIVTPLQTSVNNSLRSRIGTPYITSIISFGTAFMWVVLALLITQGGIHIPFDLLAKEPLWILTGGLWGVGIVVPTTIAYPKLGSAKTVMLLSFGQIMTSLVIDQWGMFRSPQISINLSRIIGAVVVIVGVALLADFKLSENGAEKAEKEKGQLLYSLLALFSGLACAMQVAINGTLGTVIGDSLQATCISMFFGTSGTIFFVLLLFLIGGRKAVFDEVRQDIKFKWWMLLGGLLAFILVSSNAISAPVIGAGLVTIMNLVGQMGTSLIVDATGFLGLDKLPVTRNKVIGMLLMIVGAVIITMLG